MCGHHHDPIIGHHLALTVFDIDLLNGLIGQVWGVVRVHTAERS